MTDIAGIVRQFIDETLNRGNLDGASRFVWDDVVERVPFPGQGPGLAGLIDVVRQMRVAFPDLHWSVDEQLVDGDRVLTRFTWTGTHQGPFLGVPATGRAIRVWGMVIDRLVAGRIKETRILIDLFGLMIQLGVVAPPGA
ncbi:MAG: ester cyclase [Planctomycetes bacterium]|nr:ester cyclase [Planctomycetota bacterium]